MRSEIEYPAKFLAMADEVLSAAAVSSRVGVNPLYQEFKLEMLYMFWEWAGRPKHNLDKRGETFKYFLGWSRRVMGKNPDHWRFTRDHLQLRYPSGRIVDHPDPPWMVNGKPKYLTMHPYVRMESPGLAGSAEPLTQEMLTGLAEFCKILGLKYYISLESWYYPGRSVAVIFERPDDYDQKAAWAALEESYERSRIT